MFLGMQELILPKFVIFGQILPICPNLARFYTKKFLEDAPASPAATARS